MSSASYAIETRGLSKYYGKKLAVNHMNLKVPTGSVYAFLGLNGCGKTTTIRMLLNLLERSQGEARVLGMEPRKDDLAIKRRIGYVAQGQSMYGWMTVTQVLWFCSGLYPTWDSGYADQLIRDLDIPPKEKLRNLSAGVQAKVALVLAMAHRPELLILDEPTAGLDVLVRREFLEGVIDLIQQEGRTVFFSSHLVHEVERVADWVGIVDKGRLLVGKELEDLKGSVRQIVLTFEEAPPAEMRVESAVSTKTTGRQAFITVRDYSDDILGQLKRYRPQSVEVENLPLEDIFVALVGEGA